MAEALAVIGVVSSVAQLADYGFKLSIKLFSYSEAVSRADKSIQSLSNEVSLTSVVLKELGEILQRDEAKYISKTAVEATHGTVKECLEVFHCLMNILEKSLPKNEGVERRGVGVPRLTITDKMKWPFLQPKVELLRVNLDRLKASLTLMLQVLNYAKDLAGRKKDQESLAYQKIVIEGLSRKEKEAARKYRELQRVIEQSENHTPQLFTLNRATTESSIAGQSPPPYESAENVSAQVNQPTPVDPPTLEDHSKPHLGELILLFNLILNLLNVHISSVSSSVKYKSYLRLRRATESAHGTEFKILKKEHGKVAYNIGVEAARNAGQLQLKLRELAASHQRLVPAKPDQTSVKTSLNYGQNEPYTVASVRKQAYRPEQSDPITHFHPSVSPSVPRPPPRNFTELETPHTEFDNILPTNQRADVPKVIPLSGIECHWKPSSGESYTSFKDTKPPAAPTASQPPFVTSSSSYHAVDQDTRRDGTHLYIGATVPFRSEDQVKHQTASVNYVPNPSYESPAYVNAKQFRRILLRRMARGKFEDKLKKVPQRRRPYLHDSTSQPMRRPGQATGSISFVKNSPAPSDSDATSTNVDDEEKIVTPESGMSQHISGESLFSVESSNKIAEVEDKTTSDEEDQKVWPSILTSESTFPADLNKESEEMPKETVPAVNHPRFTCHQCLLRQVPCNGQLPICGPCNNTGRASLCDLRQQLFQHLFQWQHVNANGLPLTRLDDINEEGLDEPPVRRNGNLDGSFPGQDGREIEEEDDKYSHNQPLTAEQGASQRHLLQQYQLELMRLEQQSRLAKAKRDAEAKRNTEELDDSHEQPKAEDNEVLNDNAKQDYQMQLLLLEQQNKKRLLEERRHADEPDASRQHSQREGETGNDQAKLVYQMQLRQLEQQNKKRLFEETLRAEELEASRQRSQREEEESRNRQAKQDYQMKLQLLEQENNKRLAEVRNKEDLRASHGQSKEESEHPKGTALQDFQTQLMLLEEGNNRRLAEKRRAMELEDAHQQSKSKSDDPKETALQDFQAKLVLLEQENNRRLAAKRNARELEDGRQQPKSESDNSNTHALQDYQMQLNLLDQQNKTRLLKSRRDVDELEINKPYTADKSLFIEPDLKDSTLSERLPTSHDEPIDNQSSTEKVDTIQSLYLPSRPRQGRKHKLTAEERENAAFMRKVGGCDACRKRRLKCDDGNPCKQCLKSYGYDRLNHPCRPTASERIALENRIRKRSQAQSASLRSASVSDSDDDSYDEDHLDLYTEVTEAPYYSMDFGEPTENVTQQQPSSDDSSDAIVKNLLAQWTNLSASDIDRIGQDEVTMNSVSDYDGERSTGVELLDELEEFDFESFLREDPNDPLIKFDL